MEMAERIELVLACDTIVYRTDRQVLSTARFCRRCQLATADTCFRTCRTSSFYTVAWQLARFQLTRRVARSRCASCRETEDGSFKPRRLDAVKISISGGRRVTLIAGFDFWYEMPHLVSVLTINTDSSSARGHWNEHTNAQTGVNALLADQFCDDDLVITPSDTLAVRRTTALLYTSTLAREHDAGHVLTGFLHWHVS